MLDRDTASSPRLKNSTSDSDFSGLDLAAARSVARALRIPIVTSLTLAAAYAVRLLTQDPTPSEQVAQVPGITRPATDPECRMVGFILPDPSCENYSSADIHPTPTAEQWEKMRAAKEAANKAFPFANPEPDFQLR